MRGTGYILIPEIVGHIKHEFCGRTAFAQLNAADSARIISGVHGKLLLGDFSLCPYSIKIINYFHLITSFVIIIKTGNLVHH